MRADEEGCIWLPQSFYPHLLPYGVPCAFCDAWGATFQLWAGCSPCYIAGLPGIHVFFCDYKCQTCGKTFNGLNMAFTARLPPAVRHAFPALLSADTGVTWLALNWLLHQCVIGVGFADASRAFVRESQQAHAQALLKFRLAQEAAATAAAAARAARVHAADAPSSGAPSAGASVDGAVLAAALATAPGALGAGAAAGAVSGGAPDACVSGDAPPAGNPAAATAGAPAVAIFAGAQFCGAILPGLLVVGAAAGAAAAGAPADAPSHSLRTAETCALFSSRCSPKRCHLVFSHSFLSWPPTFRRTTHLMGRRCARRRPSA